MTSTMHAAVVVAFGQPLQLQELPVPAAGPGQVLVKNRSLRCVPHRPVRSGG